MTTPPADLPPRLPSRLRQPDRRSCGAAAMVLARLVADPAYAPFVRSQADFDREVLTLHRRLTGVVGSGGELQLPWPRAVGTPPWAVRTQLETVTGRAYRVDLVRSASEASYDVLAEAASTRTPVALYVGSAWLPRHVTLVLGGDGESLRVYEPSSGRVVLSRQEAFLARRLRLGWPVPWLAVAPRP